jgi:hypothetical protein
LFIHDHSLSDVKLIVKGFGGNLQLIHHIKKFAPVIGSEGSHEFYGLCSNDLHGSYVHIPSSFFEELHAPINVVVAHHANLLKAELKPSRHVPHLFPERKMSQMKMEGLSLLSFPPPGPSFLFLPTMWQL